MGTADQSNTVILANIKIGVALQDAKGTLKAPTHFVNAENAIFRGNFTEEEFRGTQGSIFKRAEAVRRVLKDPEIELNPYLSESLLQPIVECFTGGTPIAKLANEGITITGDSSAITVFEMRNASLASNIDGSGKWYSSLFVSDNVAYCYMYMNASMTSMVASGSTTFTAGSNTITLVAQGASGLSDGTITATLTATSALTPTIQVLLEDYPFANIHSKFLTVVLLDGTDVYWCQDSVVDVLRARSNEGASLLGEFTIKTPSCGINTSTPTGSVSDWDFFAHLDADIKHFSGATSNKVAQSAIVVEMMNNSKSYSANRNKPDHIKQNVTIAGTLTGLLGTELRELLQQAMKDVDETLVMNAYHINYANSQNRFRMRMGEALFRHEDRAFFGTDEIPDFELPFESYESATNDAMVLQVGIGL